MGAYITRQMSRIMCTFLCISGLETAWFCSVVSQKKKTKNGGCQYRVSHRRKLHPHSNEDNYTLSSVLKEFQFHQFPLLSILLATLTCSYGLLRALTGSYGLLRDQVWTSQTILYNAEDLITGSAFFFCLLLF